MNTNQRTFNGMIGTQNPNQPNQYIVRPGLSFSFVPNPGTQPVAPVAVPHPILVAAQQKVVPHPILVAAARTTGTVSQTVFRDIAGTVTRIVIRNSTGAIVRTIIRNPTTTQTTTQQYNFMGNPAPVQSATQPVIAPVKPTHVISHHHPVSNRTAQIIAKHPLIAFPSVPRATQQLEIAEDDSEDKQIVPVQPILSEYHPQHPPVSVRTEQIISQHPLATEKLKADENVAVEQLFALFNSH
jgi:hypothetical protein